MKANKKEIRDFNNVVTVAIITITVISPGISNAAARVKLKAYIAKYVLNRPHNIYIHDNVNTISAIITFDMKAYTEVDISRAVDLL